MGRRVNSDDKIFAHAIYLKSKQLDWIDKHPDLNINDFFRKKIDEYIKLKEDVEKIGENDKTTE